MVGAYYGNGICINLLGAVHDGLIMLGGVALLLVGPSYPPWI